MSKEPQNIRTMDVTRPPEPKKNGMGVKLKAWWQKAIKSRLFVIVLIIVLAILPALYFYNKSKQAEKRLNDPNTANQQVINEVVKKASKHIILPSGEQPTLATVTDISKVKGQPFFDNVQNGDKVLVYTQARKAILYRPSKDIIVEVARLNIGSINTK